MDLGGFARHPGLKDRVVFVTGGGSGIGAAIVESFVDQGARVAFVDIDDTASTALRDRLASEHGRKPLFIHADLKQIDQLRAAIERTGKELGDIGVLINNAANDTRHDWRKVEPEYWDDRQAVNLRHMFFAIQAVAPQMQRLGGGSIVNFGSISWKIGRGGMPGYTTAKAAVHGLTRGMARDLGPLGIRVNTILPGWVMTERQLALWVTPESAGEIDKNQCLKNRLMPVDLARMALFLASEDARMCTAQEFIVDGGWV